MDRGAWQDTVHGVTRVGHDLATKPPPRSGQQLANLQNYFNFLPQWTFHRVVSNWQALSLNFTSSTSPYETYVGLPENREMP